MSGRRAAATELRPPPSDAPRPAGRGAEQADREDGAAARHRTPPGELAAAALDYAARGWHVLPCRPAAKMPLTAHGLDDASSDPDVVASWWRRWPDANVGIACAASGLVVVDLDGPDACDRWETLQRRYGHVGAPLIASTGRGWHFVYRHPGGRLVGTLGAGIDVKARGYVVAPPSIHPTGVRYRWHREGDPAPPPGWLVALLRPPVPAARPASPAFGSSRSDVDAYVAVVLARVTSASPGGRNTAVNAAAYTLGRFVGADRLDEARAVHELLAAADANGLVADDGLRQTERTIASALNAGRANPRWTP